MISDLILCHKVRKLFAIIITQKEEIRSQIYRKTRFILSIENKSFLQIVREFSISHRIITFGKHTYPLYEQKTSIYAVVHITRMDEL